MVIYDLTCGGSHSFEGWFSNREDFERQLAEGLISCPICGSSKLVEKPVAPAVHVGGSRAKKLDAERRKQQAVMMAPKPAAQSPATLLRQTCERIQEFIDRHFDDVGSDFSDEAIAIFVGDEEPRNITGTATADEEQELEELGIPFGKIHLPKFDD